MGNVKQDTGGNTLKVHGGGVFGSAAAVVASGDWQLSASNYVAAKMPMAITFPRDSEAASTAFCKNAYTGTEWKIPIVIQGGAWPFKFEIVSNGGATGLTIGSELARTTDGDTGRTLHTVDADYGVLKLPNPTTGTYVISVRVTDQGGATLLVPVNLTVGTSGWLFVDPNAADQTGDGTIGDPFKVIEQIHSDSSATTTYSGYRVYLRAGTTQLDGMTANNNNLLLITNNNPVSYIGYPSEAVILEAYEGRLTMSAQDDFYLADLTYQYATAYSPDGGTGPIYMITAYSTTDRLCLSNVIFNEFKGSPSNTGSGNTAILYTSDALHNHMAITGCEQTGQTGAMVSAYQWNDSVIENHSMHDATTGTKDGSASAIIYLKDSANTVTLRNIEMWDNITWAETSSYAGILLGAQDGCANIEICYTTIENAITSGGGAIYEWGFSSSASLVENIYQYRNSVKEDQAWAGVSLTNIADGTESQEYIVLDTGTMPSSTKITSANNVDGATYFDAGMKLTTGANRTSYLGTHGAEVAG